MLLVKTYLDKSSINGIGLFANQFIPKGTLIWDLDLNFDGIFYWPNDSEFLKKYCYRDGDKYVLCVDDARFMNHSDTPNTSNGTNHETIANRDIEIGEEITCNYYEIDDDAKNKLK